jgi:uncharacterized membrane protein YebE (DUF533 family)
MRAQVQANEAERALTKTLEEATADGEIDEDEHKAIDLKKVRQTQTYSLPLPPCPPPFLPP